MPTPSQARTQPARDRSLVTSTAVSRGGGNRTTALLPSPTSKKQPPSCPSRTLATCLRTPLPQNRRPGGHPNGLLPSPEKWGPRGSLDLCKMPPAKSRQCVGRKKLGPNGVEAPGGGRGKKPGPRAFSPPPPARRRRASGPGQVLRLPQLARPSPGEPEAPALLPPLLLGDNCPPLEA